MAKITRFYSVEATAGFILSIDPEEFERERGVGSKLKNHLLDLQHRLFIELNKAEPSSFSEVPPQRLLVRREFQPFPLEVLDGMMVEDFEHMLSRTDEKIRHVITARWGYKMPYHTLEGLGRDWNVTRECIRKYEKAFSELLPLHMRVHPSVLWANIHCHLNTNLLSRFPTIARSFDRPERALRFLERCCNVARGAIRNTQWLETWKECPDFLDELYTTTPSPYSYNQVVGELMSRAGFTRILATKCLKSLLAQGCMRKTPEGLVPQKIANKKSAVAHVVANYPQGLHWKKVAGIANETGIAGTTIHEKRQDGSFMNCDKIYMFGQGIYRHLNFLDLDQIDVSSVLKEIRSFIESIGVCCDSLRLIHHELEHEIGLDYYTLRHILAVHSGEEGLFFKGRSHADTVCTESRGRTVGQEEAIFRALQRSSNAMTVEEIRDVVHIRHARTVRRHLSSLCEKEKAVRMGRMRYRANEKTVADRDNPNEGEHDADGGWSTNSVEL